MTTPSIRPHCSMVNRAQGIKIPIRWQFSQKNNDIFLPPGSA
jgi:hypothetical protein